MSVDRGQAKLLHNLIDYVQQRAQYLSNDDRKNISLKNYLEKHHFTSHAAYKQYADDLL